MISLAFAQFSAVFAQKGSYHPSLIGFYNLENLYDTVNNPTIDDEEFLPSSERHYNTRVFNDKIGRLASVISQMGVDINPDGLTMLGVAEIENDTVLNAIVNDKALKTGTKIHSL